MSFTISDPVVETLEKAGVRRVYGLPGDSLNGLTATTYFQETHPQELFRECSAYCELASTATQFPFVLRPRCAPLSRRAALRS